MSEQEQTDVHADTVPGIPDTLPLPLPLAAIQSVDETDDPDLVSQSTLHLSPQPEPAADSVMRDEVLSTLFPSLERARRKIDRFPILSRLGAGGMGVVYSGYDEELDRRIAIKLVRSPDTDPDDIYSKRLLREARVMAKLGHPNVVQVYQAGLSEDGTFIAMEFIQGQTLADWLAASDQRSWREVVSIFVQAGRGLAAAHAAGIVHRDFKPANAMIDDKGVVKVLDFGLARDGSGQELVDAATDSSAIGSKARERLTQTGAMMGTPAYMSPEQFEGRPATAKSDQYNFSVALYQGLYGGLPFPTKSLAALREAACSGAVLPAPPNHKVPDWVRQLVLRGLAADPERRHESMDMLLEALERDPVARRRRVLAFGAAAIVIGLLGFVSASVLQDPQAPAPEVQSCEGVGDEIAQVWNPDRSEAIGRALVNREVGHASEVWDRVAPQLEDYAADWAEMRQEACETHLAAQQSDALFDQRTACLDQRLAGLRALLDQLDGADAAMVDNLPIAVARLPPIAFCGDTQALISDVRPPEDPVVAAEVNELRERVAEAWSYEQLGQYDLGLEQISEVVAQAEILGYAPLEAEALAQRGYLQQWRGTPDEALASLRAATLRAIEGNHPEFAAAAGSRHMLVRALYREELDPALEEAEEVESHLARVPHAQGQRGVYLNDLAAVLQLGGEHRRAVELFQDSLAVKRAAFGDRHPEVAFTLTNLAHTHIEQGAYHSASARLTEAEAIAVEALGPSHPITAEIMVSRAEVLIERRCRSEARELLERALEILTDESASSTPEAFYPLYVKNRLELLERDHGAARILAERMLELAEAGGITTQVIQSFRTLAEVELAAGHDARAVELQTRALNLARTEFGEEHRYYASSLRQLAETERSVGQVERAIERDRRVLALLERTGRGESSEVYWTLESLGRAQVDGGRMVEASETFAKAIEMRDEQGIANDDLPRARVELELSTALLELGQVEAAQATLEHALRTFEEGCEASVELALSRFALARALVRLDVPQPERAERLSQLAASALATRGPAFGDEAARVDAWRREQGWL